MAKSKKTAKTNAVRLVEQENIPFKLIEYEISDDLIDGVSVAKKTGQMIDTVFKTLVTHATDNRIQVFIIPVALELDLKKAAKIAGVKKLDLLPLQDLTKETGYIRGGCSPIGMKRAYPTYIDESANGWEKVVVSAGKPGLQMAIDPEDLMMLTGGKFVAISK